MGDLNNDGVMEVAISDLSGYLHIIEPNGQPLPGWAGGKSLLPPNAGPLNSDNYASPIIADIDGDGDLDVVAGAGVYIGAYDAAGNYTNLTNVVFNYPNARLNAAALGQFDGKGGMELAFVSNSLSATQKPEFVSILQLAPSSTTSPWPMHRRTPDAFAVQRSPIFLRDFVRNMYRAFLGRYPAENETIYRVRQMVNNELNQYRFAYDVASSEEALKKVVADSYRTILGREASASDQQYWYGLMRDGKISRTGFLEALLNSSEFLRTVGTDSAARVKRLWELARGYTPDAASVAAWANVLDKGWASYSDLVHQWVYKSDEGVFHLLYPLYFLGLPGKPIRGDALVAAAYDLRHGMSFESIASKIIASNGDYASTGTLPAWIRSIYRDVLGRDPAPLEIAYRVRQFDQGVINEVNYARDLVNSDEAHKRFVQEQFQKYLGHLPTDGGESLKNYSSREALISTIVSSQEYFNLNGGTAESFVRAAYRDIAGINPAPQDAVNAWVAQVQGGNRAPWPTPCCVTPRTTGRRSSTPTSSTSRTRPLGFWPRA